MTDTSEQHRHQCEVRLLICAARERSRDWVRGYLAAKPVAGRAEQLRKDLNQQIKLGNRGTQGTWIEQPEEPQ